MLKYKQISLEEREKIYQLKKNNIPISAIARKLNRNKSSISREIKRNKSSKLGYLPDRANNLALGRKMRYTSKIEKYPEIKDYILSRLIDDKWSPEMIAGRMKIEKKKVLISHEAIYQYIYSSRGQKLRLYNNLMYARPKRRLKHYRRHRYEVVEKHKIYNRPSIINERKEFGHFEGDLTFFKQSRNGNLSALVERKSRKVFLIKNDNKRSHKVMLGIKNKVSEIGANKFKSITFDNGGEFRQFGLLSLMGTETYFCDPGAPYQKGQVERTNAILHKFIPKKSNFNKISLSLVQDTQDKLNNLPRKCLNFLTPNEAWDNYNNLDVALQC
jgi:IS30 family transposase